MISKNSNIKTRKNILQELTVDHAKCPRCNKNILVNDQEMGEVVCATCGNVISEQTINIEYENRLLFGDYNKNKRTGDSITIARHDMGLATVIGPTDRDATGKPLSSSMRSTIKRIRKLDSRDYSIHGEKNLRIAFSELAKIKDKLSLSDSVTEKAAYIYRKAFEKKLTQGRTVSSIITAAIYLACRITNTPRTIYDVVKATDIRKKEMTKSYRLLVRELDMKIPIVDPVQCIARISNTLGTSEKTKRLAIKILKKAEQNGSLAGKDPMSFAASAMYYSCKQMDENFSQRNIADVANVSEVTIRNRYKDLQNLKVIA